jgi:hypothetical protein
MYFIEITFVQEVKPEKKTNTSIICLSKTIGYNECAQMMKNDQEIEMRLIFFYCCHEQIFKEDFILKPQVKILFSFIKSTAILFVYNII